MKYAKCIDLLSLNHYLLYLQDFDYIDDEVFQTAIRRIPPSVRRKRYISDALAEVRDDLDQRLRGCADNVTVEIHMDDYIYLPITLRSGSGSNKILIKIDEWGGVRYEWVRKTWSTYFNNAVDTVKSIATRIVSGIGIVLWIIVWFKQTPGRIVQTVPNLSLTFKEVHVNRTLTLK